MEVLSSCLAIILAALASAPLLLLTACGVRRMTRKRERVRIGGLPSDPADDQERAPKNGPPPEMRAQ
ncbi:MAG: hypothetical protein QOI21_2130 [Actinomycetota bacterium]|jgi:hypothetical protein|nr:hypothetical protein [Actinomycetota bacterium]